MSRRPFAQLNPGSDQDRARELAIVTRSEEIPLLDDALGWFPPPVYSDAEESEQDEADWDFENPNFYPDYPESDDEADQVPQEGEDVNRDEDESGGEENEDEPQNDEEEAGNAEHE